jgi:hypothetical protein
MMRQLLVAFLMILFLSSCLKQSIADAMMANKISEEGVATMSYEINGISVTTSVNNPDGQSPTAYQLGCSKTNNVYSLDFLSNSGEMGFTFFTDSLAVGNYTYYGSYGDMFILSYNNTDEFVHDPSDSVSFHITTYSQGHISGNFSGRLTPMISAGNPDNTYGSPGSALLTNGSFKNVPVFY